MPTPQQAGKYSAADVAPTQQGAYSAADLQGATPLSSSTQPADDRSGITRFGEGVAGSLGISRDAIEHPVDSASSTFSNLKEHPVSTAASIFFAPDKAIAKTIANPYIEGGKAVNSLVHGNGWDAAEHGIRAIPLVGNAIDDVAHSRAEAPGDGSTATYGGDLKSLVTDPESMGHVLGTSAQAAPLALGAADTAAPNRSLFGEVPTRAKAGALFNTVADAANNQPVSLTRSQPQLQRMAELAERGGGSLPAPINQLLNRSQRISPLTYPEARDFQSGLANMSRADADMSGPMGGQFKQLRGSLFSDVGDAAESVGQREAYEKAMKDYARASAIRNGVTKAVKYAIPAAAGTAGIGGVYHLAHSLFGGN